MGHIIALLL